MTESLETRPHVVYRLYDASGDLLYVGMTAYLDARLNEHSMDKMWWPTVDVGSISYEPYPSRSTAAAAEKAAIISDRPKHNVIHSEKPASLPRPTTEEALNELLGDWRSGDHETDLFEAVREFGWRHKNLDNVLGVQIRELFAIGMTVRQVAQGVGIPKSSVVRWSKLPPPAAPLQRPAGGLSGT